MRQDPIGILHFISRSNWSESNCSRVSTWPSTSTRRYTPGRIDNTGPQTCTRIFLTLLFVMAKKEGTPQMFQQTNGHNMAYLQDGMLGEYPSIKRNEVLVQVTTRMNPENQLSESANHRRPCALWLHVYEMSGRGGSIEMESRSVVARDWGMERDINGNQVSLGGDKKCSKINGWIVMPYTWNYYYIVC